MIKRIQIENFKSFGKVDLEPHPKVNLLIGPNSSGKSNFLEAMRLGGAFDGNLGQIEEIWSKLQYKDNRIVKSGIFEIEIWFEITGGILGLFSNIKVSKIHESLWFKFTHKDIAFAHFVWDKYRPYQADYSKNLSHQECVDFFQKFKSAGVVDYQPDVKLMRTSITLNRNYSLEKSLEGIALLIKNLDDNFRDTNFARFREDLFALTQEFNLVTTPASSKDGQIELKFFTEKSSFSVNEVSDGILLFTAILAILHQPNPPKVILLEEPENGIHPRRIIEIYRLIWKLAEEKDVQFFITTHSPILLEQFSEDPECVWVFDKVDGTSQVKNLKYDILDPRTKQLIDLGVKEPGDLTIGLGDNWLLGLIDGVPPAIFPEDY